VSHLRSGRERVFLYGAVLAGIAVAIVFAFSEEHASTFPLPLGLRWLVAPGIIAVWPVFWATAGVHGPMMEHYRFYILIAVGDALAYAAAAAVCIWIRHLVADLRGDAPPLP
jgi:hypothetical protein